MVCFAKRGFHQASMHDISAEARISVGLIYRYFANKEAVIAAMAEEHKKRSPSAGTCRAAPTLLDSLKIFLQPTAAKIRRKSCGLCGRSLRGSLTKPGGRRLVRGVWKSRPWWGH